MARRREAAMNADPGLGVQAMCGRCNTAFRVDIDAMIWRFGRDFSLINQHCRALPRHLPVCTPRIMKKAGTKTGPFRTFVAIRLSRRRSARCRSQRGG